MSLAHHVAVKRALLLALDDVVVAKKRRVPINCCFSWKSDLSLAADVAVVQSELSLANGVAVFAGFLLWRPAQQQTSHPNVRGENFR